MKKLTILALSLVMAATMLAGCGRNDDKPAANDMDNNGTTSPATVDPGMVDPGAMDPNMVDPTDTTDPVTSTVDPVTGAAGATGNMTRGDVAGAGYNVTPNDVNTTGSDKTNVPGTTSAAPNTVNTPQ